MTIHRYCLACSHLSKMRVVMIMIMINFLLISGEQPHSEGDIVSAGFNSSHLTQGLANFQDYLCFTPYSGPLLENKNRPCAQAQVQAGGERDRDMGGIYHSTMARVNTLPPPRVLLSQSRLELGI